MPSRAAPIIATSRVALPMGWWLTFDPRDDGSLQGFVSKGQRSASLAFALETGTDSTNDEDIPEPVLSALDAYTSYA